MNDFDIQNMEIKISYLERHVEEQDKEILRLNQEIALVAKELTRLKGKFESQQDSKNDAPVDERPPHY